MKRAPRSRQRHDLYAKYHDYDSEISDLLGECGFIPASEADYKPIVGPTFLSACAFPLRACAGLPFGVPPRACAGHPLVCADLHLRACVALAAICHPLAHSFSVILRRVIFWECAPARQHAGDLRSLWRISPAIFRCASGEGASMPEIPWSAASRPEAKTSTSGL